MQKPKKLERTYKVEPSDSRDNQTPTIDYKDTRGVHSLPFRVYLVEGGEYEDGSKATNVIYHICYSFKEETANAIADALNQAERTRMSNAQKYTVVRYPEYLRKSMNQPYKVALADETGRPISGTACCRGDDKEMMERIAALLTGTASPPAQPDSELVIERIESDDDEVIKVGELKKLLANVPDNATLVHRFSNPCIMAESPLFITEVSAVSIEKVGNDKVAITVGVV